jgi:hypothetical protein
MNALKYNSTYRLKKKGALSQQLVELGTCQKPIEGRSLLAQNERKPCIKQQRRGEGTTPQSNSTEAFYIKGGYRQKQHNSSVLHIQT